MIDLDDVLNASLPEGNDAGAATVRDYLIKLLALVWAEDEGFDGKRPFGNSGWTYDLMEALMNAGIVAKDDDDTAHQLIADAIQHLE